MNKVDLAIILPVLNCFEFTKKMISTIKTGHPYRLIVIDNGSTDGTEAYFRQLDLTRAITYIRNSKNKGVAGSWNQGIEFAIRKFNSRYFFIPNNDILLHSDAIDTLIEAIEAPKTFLAAATDISGQVSHPEEVLKAKPPEKREITEAPDFSCFLIKRETLEKIGYFDEKFFPAYFEDNDYHYRIRLEGGKASKTNQALYFHFGSRTIKGGGMIRAISNTGYVINRDYYIQKWGGLPGEEKFKRPYNGKPVPHWT